MIGITFYFQLFVLNAYLINNEGYKPFDQELDSNWG